MTEIVRVGGMGLGALVLLGLAKVAGVVTFVKAARQRKRIQKLEGKEKKVPNKAGQ